MDTDLPLGCCLFVADKMSQWVKETYRHILEYGTAKMYKGQDPLYGKTDMQDIRDGKDYITHSDDQEVYSIYRYNIHNENFTAYLGIKYTLIDVCKYYTCAVIVLYDKATEGYVLIETRNTRIMRRFRSVMYDGLKLRVYRLLYKYFFMLDIDYDSDIDG